MSPLLRLPSENITGARQLKFTSRHVSAACQLANVEDFCEIARLYSMCFSQARLDQYSSHGLCRLRQPSKNQEPMPYSLLNPGLEI